MRFGVRGQQPDFAWLETDNQALAGQLTDEGRLRRILGRILGGLVLAARNLDRERERCTQRGMLASDCTDDARIGARHVTAMGPVPARAAV